jgi:hypothetical protein
MSHIDAILEAQQVLQQDFHGIGQPVDAEIPQDRQTVIVETAPADFECRPRPEAVCHETSDGNP